MHNFILILGAFLILLACLTPSWVTISKTPEIGGKSDITIDHDIGLWKNCWSGKYKDKLSINSKCTSTSDMLVLKKTDVYIVQTLAILTAICAVGAAVEGSLSRFSNRSVTIIAGIATIFAIATIVYFSIAIHGNIHDSSMGISFYTQILGTVLLAMGTLFHAKPNML